MLIQKTHPTENQKSASRTNGTRSHGPATPTGKHNSVRKSFRHGLLAKTIVFDNESREQFAALLKALCDEFQPQTHTEDILVQKMAVNQWRQERIWGQQKVRSGHETNSRQTNPETCPQEPENPVDTRTATLMNVTEMRYDRQFNRALDRLLQYRAARENLRGEARETPHAEANENPGPDES